MGGVAAASTEYWSPSGVRRRNMQVEEVLERGLRALQVEEGMVVAA